jgi:predicted RNA-binding protein
MSKTFDLSGANFPAGGRYEDRYGGYLTFFKEVAITGGVCIVRNPPWCWVPLLKHLNCLVDTPREEFEHCRRVMGSVQMDLDLDRTTVEVLCSFRPETADALWKCDMQWDLHKDRTKSYEPSREFIVTTNGAYHRPEVLSFVEKLGMYVPSKKKVVLVPCAADKPYPSALHQAILNFIPDDFYMANATGVLGLVPQDLWPVMPWYDSGIPNDWRLFQTVRNYFMAYQHERIVVYLDYYGLAVFHALFSIGQLNRASFMLPLRFYADYENLLADEQLFRLSKVLHDENWAIPPLVMQ